MIANPTDAQLNARALRLLQGKTLRSPIDHSAISWDEKGLMRTASAYIHPVVDACPVLLKDPVTMASYSRASAQMLAEYRPTGKISWIKQLSARWGHYLRQDFRIVSAESAFGDLVKNPQALIVSVGGGPQRQFPEIINLNIDIFPNVDLVGDAHDLPFHDSSIDGIYCEAVLEHLADPQRAVAEMHRVLKPDGIIFAGTPFLQSYHGYPHHYQNFTITGHNLLFERCGFKRQSSGTLVGPGVCLHDMITRGMQEYFPRSLAKILNHFWLVLGFPLRWSDRFTLHKQNAHSLASVVYFIGRK